MDAADYPIFKNILYSSRSDTYVWFISHMLADCPGTTVGCYLAWESHITSLIKYVFGLRGRSKAVPGLLKLLVVFQGAGVAFGEAEFAGLEEAAHYLAGASLGEARDEVYLARRHGGG